MLRLIIIITVIIKTYCMLILMPFSLWLLLFWSTHVLQISTKFAAHFMLHISERLHLRNYAKRLLKFASYMLITLQLYIAAIKIANYTITVCCVTLTPICILAHTSIANPDKWNSVRVQRELSLSQITDYELRNSHCKYVLIQCNLDAFKRSFVNWSIFSL